MKESIKFSNTNERKIDELGRIVLPVELRKLLQIEENDYLEICKSGKNITLKKIEKNIQKDQLQNIKITLNSEIEINIDVNRINCNIQRSNSLNNSVKAVDELGRITIPIELRKKLNIFEKDTMKICVKGNMIILIKEYEGNNRKKFNSSHNRRKSR